MAGILLAPVWSLGWKIALLVLISIAIIVCVILITCAVLSFRRARKKIPEDDFLVPDDGGFNSIVRVDGLGMIPISKDGANLQPQRPVQYVAASAAMPEQPAVQVEQPIVVDPATGAVISAPSQEAAAAYAHALENGNIAIPGFNVITGPDGNISVVNVPSVAPATETAIQTQSSNLRGGFYDPADFAGESKGNKGKGRR